MRQHRVHGSCRARLAVLAGAAASLLVPSLAHAWERMPVAGNCSAQAEYAQCDSEGCEPVLWHPVVVRSVIVNDFGIKIPMKVYCRVPDRDPHPKTEMKTFNIHGYNAPDDTADFAKACVKAWATDDVWCTSEIELPNYTFAVNVLDSTPYQANPIWNDDIYNFGFVYYYMGKDSEVWGSFINP